MTHQNHQTNGASLEDCHTNFFALTDLSGIKWRKLIQGERPNASGDPLDDPVLRSYSRCLAADILCVWRRVAASKPDPDPSGFCDFGVGPGNTGTVTHPPLSLTAAKELWIFWYGDEPDLTNLVVPELIKSSEGEQQGAWETGLSYECRSLLFKALHNLIESCLLSRDVVRLGRWFVQPCSNNEKTSGKSSHHFSFSFAFFVHGDLTVCASMDLREHPPVRPLTPEYLAESVAQSQSNEGKPKPVILAPFGLAATLTGNSYRALDPASQKALNDWIAFYPLCNRDNSELPPIVEVVSGGIKMRYPSKYVLVTDIDAPDFSLEKFQDMSISMIGTDIVPPGNDLGNPFSMHIPQTAATLLPERVWQDCIANSPQSLLNNTQSNDDRSTSSSSSSSPSSSSSLVNTSTESNNNSTTQNNNFWEFQDPSHKMSCICVKCKKQTGRSTSSSSTSGWKSSSRSDKVGRVNRIPFHRRVNQNLNRIHTVSASSSLNSHKSTLTTGTSDSNSTATTTNIATTGSNSNDSVNLSTASQRSNTSIGNTTPHGGPPSNSRNPHSISESLPVPSVGSPASAGPSPLPHSTLSQPTSVPPSDQLLSGMSPLHPPSAPNIQPPTPNDNLDKNTPAPTPSDLHENINKSTTSSPYTQINSNNQNNSDVQTNQTTSGNVSSTGGSAVGTTSIATDQNSVLIKKEPAINNNNNNSNITNSSSNCNSNNISSNSNNSGNSNNNTSNNNLSNINNSNNNNYNHIVSILKRPVLSSRDYESLIDDDFLPRQLLYDYSTLTAWMNHPVKRYKPNEESKFQSKNIHDLYAGQPEYKPFSLVNTSINQTTSASSTAPISPTSSIIADPQIKQDPLALEGEQEQASPLLQAHEIKKEPVDAGAVVDKDGKCISGNLFTSEGLQVSFKDLDQIFDNSDDTSNDDTIQIHTPPGSNKSIGGHEDIKRCLNAGNPNTAILRPEELSKMFPTPPSLEHHPNSSPCGGGLFDNMAITDLAEGPKIKHEIYPNLGSPPNEPIEDWSYVFTPPAMNKFVGSSKYAPLTNLPSANLPPITLPANCVYKSTWKQQQQAQREQQQQQQQNNNQEKLQQSLSQATSNVNNNNNSSINNNRVSTPISSLSRPPSAPSIGGPNMLGPNNSMIHMNTLSGGQLIGNTNQTSQNNLGMFQGMSGSIRPGISPISPAQQSSQPFPGGVVGMTGSPMNHQLAFRRTPIPPPPPYDMAVASPATSTSSYLNKQFNSDEPPATPSNNSSRVPEANALLVNVLLYDTSLNIFRDHNFDSCTLCVCNANPKYVGNIRGADSGVYLSLPGQTFNTQLQQQQQQNNNNLYNNNYDMYGNSGLDSPSMYSSNQNGFIDKDPIKCSCGFSAVVNRRLAHRSGLFYEDEMEITGMAEDPACYKKNSILSYILGRTSCINNNNNNNTNRKNNNNSSTNNVSIKLEPNSDECNENGELIPQQMMDLLREQCALVRTSSTSIHRAIQRFKSITTSQSLANRTLNVLEYSDAHEVINLALEQSRIVFETQNIYLTHNSKMNELENYNSNSGPNSSHRILSKSIVHKWPYLKVNGPKNNQDIIRIMKSMQPLLQNAFHSKSTTRLWDAPDTVKGPLTWRQFHRMAGRGIGQCEPQPIPTVIVGHEKDWLSIAPYAIQYWDKLLLEPYSYSRDVVYIVISPDNDFVASRIKTYFKELSTTYEMCKLGRHTPIKKWDGILRVSKTATLSSPNNTKPAQDQIDDWFSLIGDNKISEMLRTYAYACQQILVPYLAKIPNDKSLLDPPESTNSNSLGNSNRDRSLASPMRPPSTPDPSQSTLNSSDKAPSTPKSENDHDNQRDSLNNSQTTITTDPLSANDDEEKDPPSIVIYVVEPFTYGSDSSELQRLACLALLRCYSNILNAVPESIRSSINFQIISQESIMELSSNRNRIRFSDEMRCLALSVFSQCRRFLAHTNNIKSLTGFGTAANIEQFLKSKDDKNRHFYKLYTPPYILAAQHEKSENTESFGQINAEQQSSVMYCSYCLSEDQSWLLAVATDDRGELLETVTINIDIPNRSRRRKASARRLGLQKLMDFILGVISQSVQPWRLVIGRIGRIGHGELKGWSWLLSKQNLLKASKQLKDVCKQCSLMYPNAVPSLLSACLVTLEPDSTFRLMPDQFTPDERFSQISMQSPLSTPQDVTCTHILVFPTSAVSQSSQTTFQQINGLELNDDELFSVLGDDDGMVEGMETMNDIFETWVNGDVPIHQNSPERNSRQGSPLEENRFRQSPGAGGVNYGTNRSMGQDAEEVGAVLQQPLAVGYLVSTAPTGRMPSWFWSSCPHLENVSPVFLKTALHLHSPSIQNTDDLLSSNQQNNQAGNHPLDSTLTADVLRYVLEGYNVLSWLAMDSNTHDRLSCLPVHVQVLMQLYHMTAALA